MSERILAAHKLWGKPVYEVVDVEDKPPTDTVIIRSAHNHDNQMRLDALDLEFLADVLKKAYRKKFH